MAVGRRNLLASLIACPICAASVKAQTLPHWNYSDEGPEKWAGLDPKFGLCTAGDQQSPLDLHNGLRVRLPVVQPQWKPEAFKVVNNGHTIQLNASPGSSLKVGVDSFNLLQFHFHTPSEHTVSGQPMAMEAHFVHQQQSGRITVLGVFLVGGQKNGLFSAIMTVAPAEEGSEVLPRTFDPKLLLPNRLDSAWRYEGSLTTPPCSQVVDWIVFDQTVSVADADIGAFKKIFPMNARPIQPTNRRFLLRS